MPSSTFQGSCAYGDVRYQMTSNPLIVHGCHCRLCQRQTGTAFAQNALIESSHVELLQGDVEETVLESASGSGQNIARCPKCHIAIWSNYLITRGGGKKIKFIRVGTLGEPDKFPPDVHIYTSTKQPWVILPTDVPAVDEGYEMEKVWSTESIKRLDVLHGRNS